MKLSHGIAAVLVCTLSATVWAGPYIVKDDCPPGGSLMFSWTKDGVVIKGYATNVPGQQTYIAPLDANGWKQTLITAEGKVTTKKAANFYYTDGRWHYLLSFDGLPTSPWRIPDLIPIIPLLGDNELFAAVNLEVYLTSNPWPAIEIGNTVSISNGEISGLDGMVFSTTEPTFDDQAVLGWGNLTPFTGDALVVSEQTPEPATMSLLALGGLSLLRRKKK